MPTPPEHEYIIIETMDKVDGQIRHFIFDHSVHQEPPTTAKHHTRADINTAFFRSNSLSLMEEGMLSVLRLRRSNAYSSTVAQVVR